MDAPGGTPQPVRPLDRATVTNATGSPAEEAAPAGELRTYGLTFPGGSSLRIIDMNFHRDRRRFLTAIGGLVGVAAAGCIASDDGADRPDGGDGSEGSGDSTEAAARESHDHESAHELGDPRAEIEVEMVSEDGYHFRPHAVHVERGGTVTWTAVDGGHDTRSYHEETHGDRLRIAEEAAPWASDLMEEPGDQFELTFETEGVYDYACEPHEGSGMVGTVVVGWPDPDGQPALDEPDGDRPDAAVEELAELHERVRDALESGEAEDEDHGREGGEDERTEDGQSQDDEKDEEGHGHDEGGSEESSDGGGDEDDGGHEH